MNIGTNDNVKCPYCRARQISVCPDSKRPREGQIVEFEQPCRVCGKMVYYWARLGILIDAERMEKVQ